MQFNPVYLYSNKLEVFTNPLASWTTERYRRVYNRNLKIYRSVDNRIDIQVRNSDQKASNIDGSTLVFNLITRETQDLILQKDCVEVDYATGKVTVILTETELLDIDPGFYAYSIIKEARDYQAIDSSDYNVTSRTPLYMDSQYGTIGVIEISGDVLGRIDESVLINKFNYTNPFALGDTNPKFYISSIIDARPTLNTANSLHTFQFYSSRYVGTVTIQGSLDDQGATPFNWVDIPSSAVSPGDNNFSLDIGTVYKNVSGKYNWFRIKHIPDTVSAMATFTITQTMLLSYNVSVGSSGRGYSVGDTIVFEGNQLGGELNTNDLTITVTAVNGQGSITGINWTGLSYNGVRTFVLTDPSISSSNIDKILYR
jgi:hypothetical protein